MNEEVKFVEIIENETKYKISTILKIKRLENYFEKINNGIDYKEAFNLLVHSEEIDINNISDKNKNIIINQIIKNNKLEQYENKFKNIDVYEKLYKILKLYYEEKTKELSESVEIVGKTLQSAFQNISQINLKPTIESALNQFAKIVEKLSVDFREIDLKVKERNENYRKWAKYGWTIIPSATFDFFYEAPISQEDADEKSLSIIDDNCIKEILEYILKNINQKHKFEEAINCFEKEYFVATAMILTSLIERNLTELPMQDSEAEKPRGKSIISKFKEQFDLEEVSVIQYFYLNNFFEYVGMLFEDGNGFVEQRYNINRNFLMHGWRDVETKRTDCIKLFLFLYNLFLVWENK